MRAHLASLVESFRKHDRETAVVDHRGVRRSVTTYGELAQIAGRFAAELGRRKIGAGERVVLWGANSAVWIGAFFGCLLRGVLAVPLDAAGSPEFARRVLTEVAPRLVVADAALISALPKETPCVPLSELESILPAVADFKVDPAVNENTSFQIIFTSGTTSEPKGIVHTHRNVLASLRPIEREIGRYLRYERWVHPLRFLHTLPLSHVFGQFMGLWMPALLGAELHFVDSVEPSRTVVLLRSERISVLVAVPRVLGLLRSHLLQHFPALAQEVDHSSGIPTWKRWWRFRAVHRALGWKFWAIISGGASLPAEMEQFWNQLGLALIQGYGMTETAALVTLNHPFHISRGTIGRALPGREVKLSDAGELLVRGDMVSTMTWQQGHLQSRGSEWLSTGDLAEQNESGEFRFIGRKGEAIVTASGMNIYPSDLEQAMLREPGVRGCAVVPCEIHGGVEPVCVLLFNGNDAALQEAVRHANENLTEYQQIRRALRWPDIELPYTSTGKLIRRKIAGWACAVLTTQTNTEMPRHNDALLGMIAEITGSTSGRADDDLRLSEDLYLDSLGRVQLASMIEQHMGVEIDEERMATMTTLGDLRQAVGSPAPIPGNTAVIRETEPTLQPSRSAPHVYPYWPWSWPVQMLRVTILEIFVRPLIAALLKPSVELGEPVSREPLLIIANHVTALDGPLVLYALPGWLRRHVAIAMSGEMLLEFRQGRGQRSTIRNLLAPIAYWLLTAVFNVFPLPRFQGFKRSFAHAGEALDRGYSVLLFPEGTRSHDGIQSFRQGVGLLATQSRVPVLPVALSGLEHLRPGWRNWFRTQHLRIRVGHVIRMPEGTEPSAWTAALEAEMRRLLST